MEGLPSRVARRVRGRRAEMCLSQIDLAAAVNGVRWTHSTVSLIESEQREVRLSEIESLAAALGFDVAELLS